MDSMAAMGRLNWFLNNVFETYANEESDKALWEFWLHKDFRENSTFDDFKRRQKEAARARARAERLRRNPDAVASIVTKSQGIMDAFQRAQSEHETKTGGDG